MASVNLSEVKEIRFVGMDITRDGMRVLNNINEQIKEEEEMSRNDTVEKVDSKPETNNQNVQNDNKANKE